MRYTENHDIDRTVLSFPKGRSQVAAAAIFTLPGVPLLYAGQEGGASERPDLFEVDPVPWDTLSAETHAFYKELIGLRKEHEVLRKGTFRHAQNGMGRSVVSYFRELGEERVLVVLNFSNKQMQSLLVAGIPEGFADNQLVDLLSSRNVEFEPDMIQNAIKLDVPGEGALILKPTEY